MVFIYIIRVWPTKFKRAGIRADFGKLKQLE